MNDLLFVDKRDAALTLLPRADRNAEVIAGAVVQQRLNDFVQRGLLVQEQVELSDGRQLRVTRLSDSHPLVDEALGPFEEAPASP